VGTEKVALVLGARGLVGRAAMDHFADLDGWQSIGVARGKPYFPTKAAFVEADLSDRDATFRAFTELGHVTHVAYSALWEKPSLKESWTASDQIAINTAMLENTLDALEAAGAEIRHVSIVHGPKAYGVHMGPVRTPCRESDPWHLAPSFYYAQEDLIRNRAKASRWTWTVLRPDFLCGVGVGGAMNLIGAIGVYAAICAELGMPLRYPGTGVVRECTDVRLVARALAWAAEAETAANEVFNLTNGDVICFEDFWPRLEQVFGLTASGRQPMSMASWMPGRDAEWTRIVKKNGLAGLGYRDVSGSWELADAAFGNSLRHDWHVSTIKVRQAGFADCIDTEEMILGYLDEMKALNLIPQFR
jgi:nucleoside-diphosphate-sugar epimerase